MEEDLAAAVEGAAQRVEAQFARARLGGAGEAELGEEAFDGGGESAARGGGGGTPGAGADQDLFERTGDGPPPAEGFALGEDGLDGFDELAAAGGGVAAQPGEVTGEADDLPSVGRTGGVVLGAQGGADPDGGGGERLGEALRVSAGVQDGVLPLRVADARRVAGAGVEQRVGVRDQREDVPGVVRAGRFLRRDRAAQQGGGVEGADDHGDPAPAGRGGPDAGTHPGLAAQVVRVDAGAGLGVVAQGPADQEGSAPDGLRGGAGGGGLDQPVPEVLVAVAAGEAVAQGVRHTGGRRAFHRAFRRAMIAGTVAGGAPWGGAVGERQVAGDGLDAVAPRPAQGDELRGEIGERVEGEPTGVVRTGRGGGQGDRGLGGLVGEPVEPGLELGGQFDQDHLGTGGVEQRGKDRAEGRRVVAHADQVGPGTVGAGAGQPVGLDADVGVGGRVSAGPEGAVRGGLHRAARHRQASSAERRSHRVRQVAAPCSARRRTGPSQ